MVGGSGRRSATREYRSRHRLRAQVRVLLGGASLGLTLISAACLLPAAAGAQGTTRTVALDRQYYVSDAGPDIYQASSAAEGGVTSGGQLTPDPIDIHIAAAAMQMTYHAFIHLELPTTPSGFSLDAVTVTLFPTTNPQRAPAENVNTSQTILDAYPLTTELPAKFDPNKPPAFDTSEKPVVGKINNANGTWSFDLTRFTAYWAKHGNTGAAIVPDAGAATQPWSIGFDKTLSAGSILLTPVPAPSAPAAGSGTGGLANTTQIVPPFFSGGAPIAQAPIGSPPSAAATTPAAAAGTSPAAAAGAAPAGPAAGLPADAPAVAPAAGESGGVPVWLVVLLVSAVAAVALLAQPVSQALASTAGVRAGLLTQWKVHPRLLVVAGGLVVWSSVFSVYANTTGKSTSSAPSVAQVPTSTGSGSSSSATSGAGGAATPGAPPSATGAGPGAGAAAPGAVASHAGTNAPTGSSTAANPYPNAPNPPAADLFSGADDTKGITSDHIQLCAHAALTFGPAFNIGASDLNVFWQMLDDKGGIYGRKVVDNTGKPGIEYQDDGYQPSKAVTAAQQCLDDGTFFLLGGIGFDQIPAVRVWAEQNHMLYIHHIATAQGSAGLQYSYTMLPTLEQVGASYGQYYIKHMRGDKAGVIYRNSSNWDPGRIAFDKAVTDAGVTIVDQEGVVNNQGDYTSQIVKLEQSGAQTVLIWENAIYAEQIIQQAHNQGYNPKWVLFPFNLTLQTLEKAGVNPNQMQGLLPLPAYTCPSLRGSDPSYNTYKSEFEQFEAAYAKYDSGANLCGGGGDLLFETWEAWKQTADLLTQCGPSCTRNKLAGLLDNGYHAQVGANCPIDFRGDGHHGGGNSENEYLVRNVNGTDIWANVGGFCQGSIQ